MSEPMSKAPAVIRIEKPDGEVIECVPMYIFDAYKAAVDAWFGDDVIVLACELRDLMQAARQAGESVK